MSGVAIIAHQLANSTPLLARVPDSRIHTGIIPLKETLPAINVKQVDGNSRNTVRNDGTSVLWTDRVQVTVVASSYKVMKEVLLLVQAACGTVRGTVAGVRCDSIVDDTVGPDVYDPDTAVWEQSQDFMVKFVV